MKELFESLFEYNIELPDYILLEDDPIYINLLESISEIIPEHNEILPHNYYSFLCALKILAYEFIRFDQHGWATGETLLSNLEQKIEYLSLDELIEMFYYFKFIDNSFKFEAGNEIFTDGKERISCIRLEQLLIKTLIGLIDFQLCKIKIFLRYKYPKKFWYNLYAIKYNSDIDDYIDNYEAEKIDHIVHSLLDVYSISI